MTDTEREIMEQNNWLLDSLINETSIRNSDDTFEFIEELRGVLPRAVYQWIKINDEVITTNNSYSYLDDYLIKLNSLGLLIKISEDKYTIDSDEPDGSIEKKIVKYRINV